MEHLGKGKRLSPFSLENLGLYASNEREDVALPCNLLFTTTRKSRFYWCGLIVMRPIYDEFALEGTICYIIELYDIHLDIVSDLGHHL